ncbi:MAG: hypothetical protein O7G87_23755, partial [bacterium]|nr:hypothetical protein [bacterium]
MAQLLLEDEFDSLEPGMFSAPVGAHTEYHYLPEAAPRGNWTVACFGSGREGAGEAWHIQKENGHHAMAQTFQNKRIDTHPTVIAGETYWENYTLRVTFTPQEQRACCGVLFRYQNSRCNYFFGFNGPDLILKMVHHGTAYRQPYEKILAQQSCNRSPGETYTAQITVDGPHIRAEIEGLATLEAEDTTYPTGKIGLQSDVPTVYHTVQVTADAESIGQVNTLRSKKKRELEDLRAQNPKPVLWKKISTEGFGVGRNLRFGDLTGNGKNDVLIGQMHHHGPRDAYSELSCLTAMTFDGDILWQIGTPDPEKYPLTNDVGFQIHDIDGDGKNEVIYCQNFEIIVADGATGQFKYKAPTPKSKPPADKFPQILGDCLFFCDLRGLGRAGDLLIKDRYWNFWILNDKLELQWEHEIRTGHYPFAFDIDNDGHDELAMGHAMFDHDGSLLWNLENNIEDHVDGIAIANFQESEDSVPKILYAGSDSGIFFADLQGNVLKHHWIGHGQNPAIANLRPDLPGLEVVSINFWGNQGILHFYDAHGDIYHSCEPNPFGSMCLPINWTGTGVEYFVHSPHITHGGMFDGWGRPVVMFPDDGHPD